MEYKKYNKTVGQNIKRVRISKRLTQMDLEIMCELAETTVSRIETGRTNPTLKTIFNISVALKINILELIPPT